MKSLFFRVKNGVYSLPSARPESITVIFSFLCSVLLTSTNADPSHRLEYLSAYQLDRQCTYKHNTDMRSHNHCCHGKAVRVIHTLEYVSVALVIQHAKCVCVCLDLLHNFCLLHSHSGKNSVRYYHTCTCKVPIILV